MHVVIMGCGRVGTSLARRLDQLGHSVAVIDQDPEAFRRLGAEFRGSPVTGVGFDRNTLLQAGIDRADAFAAVSSGDNSNIISARVAREIFGVRHVVARIYDPKRAEVYERLSIPTVATVPWTADRLFSELMATGSEELWRDPTGSVGLCRIPFDDGWVGHPLDEVEARAGIRVAYIERFGVPVLPGRGTVLQSGDALFALVPDAVHSTAMGVLDRAPERMS